MPWDGAEPSMIGVGLPWPDGTWFTRVSLKMVPVRALLYWGSALSRSVMACVVVSAGATGSPAAATSCLTSPPRVEVTDTLRLPAAVSSLSAEPAGNVSEPLALSFTLSFDSISARVGSAVSSWAGVLATETCVFEPRPALTTGVSSESSTAAQDLFAWPQATARWMAGPETRAWKPLAFRSPASYRLRSLNPA
jgi:hypothetical protein